MSGYKFGSVIWGEHARINIIGDHMCEKVYTEETLLLARNHVFDPYVFSTIKTSFLNNFGKLYSYTYDTERRQITRYIMQFYLGYDYNILEMSVNYTIENFSLLFDDILTLSPKKIITSDMNHTNVIFTDDKIIVIDLDNFKYADLSVEEVTKINIENLCFLFRGLYKEALYDYFKRECYISGSIDKVIDLFTLTEGEFISKSVCRKLRPYSKPINYLCDM